MLTVGCKLLREWGPEIGKDVWREHIASRYISNSRGGNPLTEEEMKTAWTWIEGHANNNNDNNNNQKEKGSTFHETANILRPST